MSALSPSVVIFSSSNIGLDIAKKLEAGLGGVAKCKVWNKAMRLSFAISDQVQKLVDDHDFAICVLTGDRDSGQPGELLPSENVLFEAGLCFGRLGPERTFLFCYGDQHRLLPDDLRGVIHVQHTEGEDLARACDRIADAIVKQPSRIRQPHLHAQFNDAVRSIGRRLGQGLDPVSVELIQHSSERASILVAELINRHVDVDMYLQHPDVTECFSRHSKMRIVNRVDHYAKDCLEAEYRGVFRIYYYKTPASFSGVRIHLREDRDLFFLGWYTYTALLPWQEHNASGITLVGGENPCIEVDVSVAESEALSQVFKRQCKSVLRECPAPVFEFREGNIIRSPEPPKPAGN